uniref:Phosphatidylinositol transfer protein n=1 Tax=Panagrolaimus davidi TaxID=227884 RepID=A0A914Q8M4_9BILA
MIIKEYRVLLPLEVSEYQRGQLFSVAEASKNETGGGEGVEILKQEAFTSAEIRPGQTLSGVYTHKLYHLKSKMPWIVRKLFPESAMVLDEECWNAYPYCKTVITNPGYMKKDFYIIIETIHVQDDGTSENALNAPKEVLKQREVVVLDIYQDVHLNKKTVRY